MEELQPKLRVAYYEDHPSNEPYLKVLRGCTSIGNIGAVLPRNESLAEYSGRGTYKNIDPSRSIREKEKFNKQNLVTAKLRKPVNVSAIDIVKSQPSININDPYYRSLSDLDFNEQEEVLGKATKEVFNIKSSKIVQHLREIVKTQPNLHPTPTLSKDQLLQLLNYA